MAGEKHMRLTIHGDYTPGSVDAPEVWAINLRQALVFGSVSDVDNFPSNWSVDPNFETHTETDWTTSKTWIATGPLGATFDPESYLTDQVGPALQNWMGAAGFSNHVRCTGASIYPCGTDGKAIGHNVAHLDFTTIPVGTSSGKMLPTENSAVVSWVTHVLGARGRGRVYPPPITVDALTSYGVLDSSWAATYLNSHKNTIEALSYSSVGAGGAHVRSVVTGPSSTGGAAPYTRYGTIIGARVGQVVDTQRRRRNKLPEAYQSEAVSQ